MGNANRRIKSEDRQYPFVGREREIKKILKDINGEEKLVVQIHGMPEIGASRVLTQVLKKCLEKRRCILMEFFSNSLNSANIEELLVKLQNELNFKKLPQNEERQNLPSQDVTTVIDDVVKKLESLDEPTWLFVDDSHKVQDVQFKTYFLHFLNKVCNSQTDNFKVIFTASEKVRLTSRAFSDCEVGTLRTSEIRKLFESVIKEKGTNDDDDNSDDEEDHGEDSNEDKGDDNAHKSLASMILSKSNQKFIDALMELCAGLPKVAIMIGSELTANDGLFEPKDMIVLLIKDCLHTLSPECYPDLDKGDTYKKPLQNLNKRRELIDAFNSKMGTDNTASINDVKEVGGKDSNAEVKQNTRLVVDNNVMQYSLKSKKFRMHSIFRECLLAMKSFLTEEDENIKSDLQQGRLKLAKLAGAPEDIADDLRKLENFLNSLVEDNNYDSQDDRKENYRRQDNKEPTKTVIYFPPPYCPEKLMSDHARMEICSICRRPFHVYNNYVDNINMDTCMCSKKLSDKNTNSGYDSLGGPHALRPVSLGECDSEGDGTGCNNLGRMCNGSDYQLQAAFTRSLNISEENEGSRGVLKVSNEAKLLDSGKEINGKDEMVDQRLDQGKKGGVIQDAGLAAEILTNGIATTVEGSIRDKPTIYLECEKLEVDSQEQKPQGNLNLPSEKLNFDVERKDGAHKELVKTGSLKVPKRLENGESEEFGKTQNKAGLLSPDTGLARSLNDSD